MEPLHSKPDLGILYIVQRIQGLDLKSLSKPSSICIMQKDSADTNSTIGAGDTFIAGMLYSLLYQDQKWDLSQKLSYANRVAGMKVAQEGFLGLERSLELHPGS